MQPVAFHQVGNKKDRTYHVRPAFSAMPNQWFTVKGLGKAFTIFNGDKEVATFKTLTECKQYVGGL